MCRVPKRTGLRCHCDGSFHTAQVNFSIRGFDQDMAKRIGVYMQQEGIKFLMETVTESGEKLENG